MNSRDNRIRWWKLHQLARNPRRWFFHSLFWTGMGSRWLWWRHRMQPVRSWAYRHINRQRGLGRNW